MQDFPLTEAQSGLWYAQKLDPDNPILNTGHYADLRGPLDRAAFAAAADAMAVEAQSLSLRFAEHDGDVRQTVDPALAPRLRVIDLTGGGDPESVARDAMAREMETPVDLTRGPLAGQALFLLSADRALWFLRAHHLAVDGYGVMLLTRRVADLYNAAVAGAAPGAAFPPFAIIAEEDAAWRNSDRRAADAEYWRAAMQGMEEVAGLAAGRAVTAHRAHRSRVAFDADTTQALQARARALNLTWPDVVTAIAAAYVARFTGAEETAIGVPFMGRMGGPAARIPAQVMNILPLRVAPAPDARLDAFALEVGRAMAQGRRHGRYRSEQMRRDLGLIGGARRLYGPLVNILPFDRPPVFAGLEAATVHILGTGPVDDIHFDFRGDAAPSLSLETEANPDLYSAEEAAAHGARLAAFVAAALKADRLSDIPIATPAEAVRELEGFNATAHPVPDMTLAALLEAMMRATPDAPALTFGETTLSYAELDRRTAALAAQLRARGVGADALVAVSLHRSPELVIALVATLRAGGAYLPLDPDHPARRVAGILASAAPRVVLSDGDAHGLFGDLLLHTQDWAADGAFAPVRIGPGDAAYVIYTSGSTGDPKGVLVEHRAIVNRLLWMQAEYGIGAHTRILQKTPATFDVSVWEFFLAFISGGELVVAPPGAQRDPAALAALIRRHAITDLHFVPSMLTAFLAEPAARDLTVRHVFCSGEELPADLRDAFHRTLTAELHNLYGPTEAAVDVSYWPAGPDDESRPVPIGWPVWNTRLLILDAQMRPVAPGMTGDLYLGGVQLARGYLGRPDLTADRFLPDPHHPGGRLYKTGDVARRRDDGAVLFLGRADFQVKIRGLRIELGEIESAIAASAMTKEQAVIAREDRPGEKRLVAYLVPDAGYDAAGLRAALAARLPDYMLPSAFVAMDAFPLTSSGKLDRKALPAPVLDMGAAAPAPMNATEATLADIYRDILGLPAAPGPDGDFFTLGGDSLQAVHLMLRVREEWGQDPGLGALFDRPRVADLAALIGAGGLGSDSGLGPLIRLVEGDPDLPPLFVVHPAGGLTWGYRTLARALSPRRTVYGLQSPALDPDTPLPDSIDALAADYAARVRALGAPGPVHLMGWSVGGLIAQAMAVEMEATGQRVGLMAMLDSYPAECWRAEAEPDPIDALRALLTIAGYDPLDHLDLDTRAKIVGFLRTGDSPLGGLPDAALDGVIRVVLDTNRLVRRHHHRPFGGVTVHVRASVDHAGTDLTPELWRPHAPHLDRVDAPFLHPQLTGPAASAVIAPALDARMRAAETEQET